MEQRRTPIPWNLPLTIPDGSSSRRGTGIPNRHSMGGRWGITAPASARKSSRMTWPFLTAILVSLIGVYWMQPSPSQGPITYRMGAVDERFSLRQGEAAGAVREAGDIWSRAAGRELFREDPRGGIEVRFIYDYRQEASDRLKGMSGSLTYTRGTYESLKARLEREESAFRQGEAQLQEDVREYNRQVDALNYEIASSKNGLNEEAYRRVTMAQEELNGVQADLQRRRQEQQERADSLNRLVEIINDIAARLNLEVVKYNRTGSLLGTEFNEGLYERKNNRETVTIYHFTSRDRLVRVLAHELGHALGLGHNDNPRSIMYRLNQSDSLVPSADDIAALKAALNKKSS